MTNFSYNRDIPAANNSPSVDQPDMKDNFNNIDSLIDVNHISFGQNNGGMHRKVQLPLAISAPATVAGEIVVYSQNHLGNPCLFQQRQSKLAGAADIQITRGDIQPNAAANGTATLIGGAIFQWGSSAVNTSGTPTNISFPVVFPNNALNITLACVNNQGNSPSENNVYIKSGTVTTSGFTVTNSSSGGVTDIYWMAVGN